jgi:YebC/PmpR family DNA-binding regulatory protein
MSGHNKWSKIKHKKAATDAKKSKVFSMYAKMITVESRRARGDKSDPGLVKAIERARSVNMPNDNIDRAVTRGLGADSQSLEEVIYEAYGPGGAALIIEGITDNKNRTTPEIKHLLSSNGGNLGAQGSTLWAFAKNDGAWQAKTIAPINASDQEKLANLIEALEEHDDIKSVTTNADL